MNLSHVAKAIVAFFAAPVTLLLGNLEKIIVSGGQINWKLQLLGLAIGVWTSIVVWACPNSP